MNLLPAEQVTVRVSVTKCACMQALPLMAQTLSKENLTTETGKSLTDGFLHGGIQ